LIDADPASGHINMMNANGMTALDYALQNGSVICIALLMEVNATVGTGH
jgi:hypothetical protein